MNALSELSVGETCFTKSTRFLLTKLLHVKSVTIGSGSFEGEERKNGRFVLQNLNELSEFKAKMRCFRFVQSVTIESVSGWVE